MTNRFSIGSTMLHCRTFLYCLVVGTFLYFPFAAKADISPIMFVGGSVCPVSCHKSIRMDSMDVMIRFGWKRYQDFGPVSRRLF